MTKSESISPLFLKRIDELTRPNHPYLQEDDEVYFFGECLVPGRFDSSPMNQLIHNYKKGMDRKGNKEWEYKIKAIETVASYFSHCIFNAVDLCDRAKSAVFIPIQPSQAKGSPGYDDRNYKMLKMLSQSIDVRELILQKESREPLHSSTNRRDYLGLLKNYYFNESEIKNDTNPKEAWLFDDTLVKGTHFKAAKQLLKTKIPNIRVVGFFIARSVQIARSNNINSHLMPRP